MAVDRRIVEAQLRALGDFHQWFTKKEVRHLPTVLNSGETIRAVTSGVYQGNTWLVTVTDQRILFLDKGMFYGVTQVELPLRQINTISYTTGLLYGELRLITGSGRSVVKKIRKVEVEKISAIVSSLVRSAHSPTTQPKTPTASADVASQLERLAKLMERGILTPDEFAAQKAKLLA
jgi:PH (Pleckstrin Homology) domain-containing protein/putative oligomerization/nucleic acid binding protein